MNPMKPLPILLVLAVFAGTGCELMKTTPPAVPVENITVKFDQPDNFTDVREHFGSGTSEVYLDMLREHVQQTAATRLQAGQKLTVTFKDIDLAGDHIPGRIGRDDIRIVKDIYIPRMELSFQLTDAAGAVVAEGDRQLSNMNFMNEIQLTNRNDPLNYDKNLLTDWMKSEFRK